MSLPRELRDRIYEFSFYCEPYLVVFAGKTRPSHYSGPKDPETVQVASEHKVLYPGSFAAFGGQFIIPNVCKGDLDYPCPFHYEPLVDFSNNSTDTATAPVRTEANWSKSLTGILYVNKQISSEAASSLLRSCDFFFEDLDLSQKFLGSVQPTNLESIRKISIHYPDELEIVHTLYHTVADNRAPMRQQFYSLCEQIVKMMPKVKELTLWIGDIFELEYGGTRCETYERALLQLAALKELKTITVKKYGTVLDNSGVAHCWEGQNEYTVGGVKEMIETDDPTALDRWQKAFEDGGSG